MYVGVNYNIGSVVMATPTKVATKGKYAWRVKSIFFFFPLLSIELFSKRIKSCSICKQPKYNQIYLNTIRETRENVGGHGSLTPSVLSPMGTCSLT